MFLDLNCQNQTTKAPQGAAALCMAQSRHRGALVVCLVAGCCLSDKCLLMHVG